MKELSIEEKAKAYDEALKVLHKYDGANIMFTQDLKEEMFPELKESEDERIRKALIDGFTVMKESKNCGKTFSNHNIPVADILAWLEKQGEHTNFRNKIQIGDKVTRNQDGVLVNLSQLNRVAKKDEKHGEQKPADKVEPKFHEGDWIITNKNHIWYVSETPETTSYLYRLINQYGKVEVADFEAVDEKARLWTIEDAKDGDVLCTYECGKPKNLFILKGTPKKHYALSYHCYCNLIYPHFESDSEKGFLAPNYENVTPATKEQRKQLEKAMSDAGYTFDFENKELKKIEQNPAWSEEDEDYFDTIIAKLEVTQEDAALTDNQMNFLKSLKYRVHPQPKQKWSEEDKERYISCLQRLGTDNPEQPETINSKWFKEHVYPQSTWKPNDEQMERLRGIINSLPHQEVLYSLYQDLKKLK